MLAISTYPLSRINFLHTVKQLRQISTPIGLELFYDELPSHQSYFYEFRIEDFLEKNLLSMHSPCVGCDPLAPDNSQIWQHTLELHKNCFDLANKLGIRHVVFHPNSTNPINLIEKNILLNRIDERICFFANLAKEYNLTMRVENVGFIYNNSLLLEQEEFVGLFATHSNIEALIDIGHAHINSWDIPKLVQTLGNRITAYHLHDNDKSSDGHIPIGCGTVNWQELWSAIKTYTPLADLTVEYGKSCSPEEMIEDCLHLLKK